MLQAGIPKARNKRNFKSYVSFGRMGAHRYPRKNTMRVPIIRSFVIVSQVLQIDFKPHGVERGLKRLGIDGKINDSVIMSPRGGRANDDLQSTSGDEADQVTRSASQPEAASPRAGG